LAHCQIMRSDSESLFEFSDRFLILLPKRVEPRKDDDNDDVIDHDLFFLGGDERRIVTGADLLDRLMRGIVRRVPASSPERATLAPLAGPSKTYRAVASSNLVSCTK
jgi:hypothetical protein